MAIIRCPQCDYAALFITDESIKSKTSIDRVKAEDFKIILFKNHFMTPFAGDPIRCRSCNADLGAAIHKKWKEFPREREWEE